MGSDLSSAPLPPHTLVGTYTTANGGLTTSTTCWREPCGLRRKAITSSTALRVGRPGIYQVAGEDGMSTLVQSAAHVHATARRKALLEEPPAG